MVRNLLIINVVVFILQGSIFNPSVFALYHFGSDYFNPIQFVTHMFLHADWAHLFSNMFTLFMFGPMLERFWGTQRFLIFFLITGVGASLFYSGVRAYELYEIRQDTISYIESPSPIAFNNFIDEHEREGAGQELAALMKKNPEVTEYTYQSKLIVRKVYEKNLNGLMLGASGAVFGILMAFGMLFPNLELMLLFFPVPIKAKYFVLGLGALELYLGVNRVQGDNVAHFAHLGGALFAYILIKMWGRNDYREY
jgi:membrane associated rhomboid family serine protease